MGIEVTENQIDHIGINKMFRRSLQDVGVKRGADVASDHHLVTARLKLKLRRNGVEQERRKARYNVDFLKDPRTAEEYKITLANRFKVLQKLYGENEVVDINSQWSHIKDAVNTICEEIIGRRNPQQKDWISAETIRKIQTEETRRRQSTAAAQGRQR